MAPGIPVSDHMYEELMSIEYFLNCIVMLTKHGS